MMPVYRQSDGVSTQKYWLKKALFVGVLVFISILIAFFIWFRSNLEALEPVNESTQSVTIEDGVSDNSIGELLESKKLIKSSLAYDVYIRLNGLRGQQKAGSYEISPSMNVPEIAEIITQGDVAVDLITILPGQRLADLRQYFIAEGYLEAEVDEALDVSNYRDHPVLSELPALATLEGYLAPESFQYTDQTPLQAIIEQSLDITANFFTPKLEKALKDEGLNKHQAVILASIVEKEVSIQEDKEKVAQVFLTRLDRGMMLGSDPTAYYGASLLGLEESVLTDTAYNTRIYTGLPPGPISNFTISSLSAVANPASTDFLYFVSGDDGVTHFSKTLAEHERLTELYCTVLCSRP